MLRSDTGTALAGLCVGCFALNVDAVLHPIFLVTLLAGLLSWPFFVFSNPPSLSIFRSNGFCDHRQSLHLSTRRINTWFVLDVDRKKETMKNNTQDTNCAGRLRNHTTWSLSFFFAVMTRILRTRYWYTKCSKHESQQLVQRCREGASAV